MTSIRQPAVGGLFYPSDAAELRSVVQDFLAHAKPSPTIPKAIIAPHAGYFYSGPIAGSAYAGLKPKHDCIDRVILLGPSHRVGFTGVAISSADRFATPLGEIPMDKEALAAIQERPFVHQMDSAHSMEHSLEVQLPFLQEVLDDFSLVPLVVGDATPSEISEILEILWGGNETLIVVSSDLSHDHDYETACQRDRETSRTIESLRFEDLKQTSACGRVPVSGLLYYARRIGLRSITVDLRNSGDTSGSRDRVVGYGAYVLH